MRDSVMIDWRVPTSEWDAFREHVQDEFGSIEGYLGREAERAMREYADNDGGDGVEDLVDQLVQAAGRTPEDAFKEKKSWDGEDRTRVTARVDSDVKESFQAAADQGDDIYGVAFARAIRARREGGRYGRLERKLDRVVEDAESVLAELDDSEDEETMTTVERRTVTICNRLPEQFTDDELVAEIADVAGSSNPTIERYRERVVDRLGVEPHPNAPSTVWVPESVAAEDAPDGMPRECRQPVDLLDRDDRVRRIQFELGKKASRNHGQARATATEIIDDVFDGDVSRSSTHDLMHEVALEDGFELDRNTDSMSLKVNVAGGITDEELADDLRKYVRAESDGLLGWPTETTVDDWSDGSGPQDVESEWNTLATADGGSNGTNSNGTLAESGDTDTRGASRD